MKGTVLVSFLCCDKIPERNNLKEAGLIFPHIFRVLVHGQLVSFLLGLR
jgi:hypothetical protein